jgi:hypothetical protein
MTTLRKWRFTVLIGSGIIAAGALVYFSNGHVGTDKTQGAIGKRDVYRDGQVASADVATPGSAPVATEAILESSEFKALAKDPQFHQLLNDESFKALSANAAFLAILGSADLRGVVQRTEFAAMLNSEVFKHALASHENLAAALETDARFGTLARSAPMERLFASDNFKAIAGDHLFGVLVGKSYFNSVVNDKQFGLLASHADFLSALENGSMQRMTFGNGGYEGPGNPGR